jgi:hypothetical protein
VTAGATLHVAMLLGRDLRVMVGTVRFELTTPTTPLWCATRLRYAPRPERGRFLQIGRDRSEGPAIVPRRGPARNAGRHAAHRHDGPVSVASGLPTPTTPLWCATRLRYAPMTGTRRFSNDRRMAGGRDWPRSGGARNAGRHDAFRARSVRRVASGLPPQPNSAHVPMTGPGILERLTVVRPPVARHDLERANARDRLVNAAGSAALLRARGAPGERSARKCSLPCGPVRLRGAGGRRRS